MYSKWGSFNILSWPATGEFSATGSGPRLIPVVLPVVETEQWLSNSNSASLRANPPSQASSFHLSLPIAIITGDNRQIHYPATTTLVSLLGYNSAILYSSHFPLLLSGPSFSNPPTSYSANHLITSLGTAYASPSNYLIIFLDIWSFERSLCIAAGKPDNISGQCDSPTEKTSAVSYTHLTLPTIYSV